jgi:cytochrome c biogenesis protein CcmG/thiol:disulfide interchange protein DsbE
VRFPRFLSSLLLLTVAFASACNRGSHPAQTGKAAPDFTVNDGTTTVHLANYRGKVVLLNFWATWCQPCVAELPSLIQLHHDMPNLVVVGISIDEDPDAYTRFLTRHRVDFITVRDPAQSSPKLFHTDMWPETYVIDRNGYIRSKYIGAQDWSDPEIRTFLKSL